MEIENVLRLRNELVYTSLGEDLLSYLQDILTKNACIPNKDGENIKGFAECIQAIKDIPKTVENMRK